MAKKSSTTKSPAEKKPEMSAAEKQLLAKYAQTIKTAVNHGWYSAIPQTDMVQLHAIYKRWENPKHIPNTFCGNCNMTVLRGLEKYLQK